MLEARALTKRYGPLVALDRVSFILNPGEIVGYLGPNGSGKSTTVNLVVGLLEPSAGFVAIDGVRLSQDRCRRDAPAGPPTTRGVAPHAARVRGRTAQ